MNNTDIKNSTTYQNIDIDKQDTDLEKDIEAFEKAFLQPREIKKMEDNFKWFKLSRIFCSLILVFTLINFLCLFVMFAYHTIYFLTISDFKIWENNFYSLLMPLPIINAVLIVINLALYGFFVYFCAKYDDNGKDVHLDAVSAKLSFFSRWNLIMWVFVLCFYAVALAGLTLIFSNYQAWVWTFAIFIIFILTIVIMVFSVFIAIFIFKKMDFSNIQHIKKI